MKEQIIEAADSPRTLEELYRENPQEFTRFFPDVFAEQGDSIVLQIWHERLFFQESEVLPQASSPEWQSRDFWMIVILSFIAGTLVKLPHFLPMLDDERFFSRNFAGIIAGTLMAFFFFHKPNQIRVVRIITSMLIGGMIFLNLLPDNPRSPTITLSCLHMSFLFWALLGIAFTGGAWRDLGQRMDYVRYNGELLIYSTIILIGGMVLTGLTFSLFGMINFNIGDIGEWYMRNVVVYGTVASPIVATLLIERIVGNRFKIAPLLARAFTPLFLLTLVLYLFTMLLELRSPFTDRDFLIAFNVLLLVILGLCVFSISERGSGEEAGTIDFMNMMLVAVTLVIDVIALAAILFRLTSYGFTPNRIAVLGANFLAFGHLAGILWYYIRFAGKKVRFERLEQWIVTYLPAYTVWSLIVSVGFPLIFWFT